VTSELYPNGSRGIVGYGVKLPSGSPSNASLIEAFLPYVIFDLARSCLTRANDRLIRANFTNAVCGIEINHKDDPVPDGFLTMGAVDTTA